MNLSMKQVSDIAVEECAVEALCELTVGELRELKTELGLRHWLRDHRTEADLSYYYEEYWEARRDEEGGDGDASYDAYRDALRDEEYTRGCV